MPAPDYGYVGDIMDVDPAPVIDVLQQGYIPVVSTVAQGIDDETNYNINADTAASKLAVALGAKKLILLTDVRGLMLDVNDPGQCHSPPEGVRSAQAGA